MSSKKRVALIVDHPLRDLAGMVLVAVELAKRGVDVHLVPMCFQTRELFALAPDFVVLNYVRESNAALIRALQRCGIAYGLLETEGGFYGDMHAYGRLLPQDRSLVDGLAVHCVWGERMAQWWRETLRFDPSRLVLTGLPRFDWYAEDLRQASLGLMPPSWRDSRELILFNTKVSVANPRHVTPAAERESYRKLGFSEQEIERHASLGMECIRGTVQLAAEVAARHADKACVIRPHPHENAETYRQHLRDKARGAQVRVAQEGTVTPWVNKAAVLIHRQCTTAIEAVLAGRPAIAPQWVATSANAPDAELVSFCPQSRAEFDDILSAALNGQLSLTPAMAREKQRMIDDWLTAIDGRAAERTADAIVAALPDKRRVDLDQCRSHFYQVFGDGLSRRLYRGLNRLAQLGIAAPKTSVDRLYQIHKTREGKSFTQRHVADVLRCLAGTADCTPAQDLMVKHYAASSIQVTVSLTNIHHEAIQV